MSSLKFYAKPNPMGCKIRLRYTYNRDSRCDFFCGVEITDEKNFNSDNDLTPIKKGEKDYEIKNARNNPFASLLAAGIKKPLTHCKLRAFADRTGDVSY